MIQLFFTRAEEAENDCCHRVSSAVELSSCRWW